MPSEAQIFFKEAKIVDFCRRRYDNINASNCVGKRFTALAKTAYLEGFKIHAKETSTSGICLKLNTTVYFNKELSNEY